MAGSPEVKALGDQVDTEPPRSDQPGGRATRRAVAQANGMARVKFSPRAAEEWDNITHVERGPQGSGGPVYGQGLVLRVERSPVVGTRPKAGVNVLGCTCRPGIRLKGCV